MADLMIRRGGGGQIAQTDPLRLMRDQLRRIQNLARGDQNELFGWDPFQELEPLLAANQVAFLPDFEVRDTRDALLFQADVPGVKEEDIDVTVVGNQLRISGKREMEQEQQGDTWYRAERSYGNFTRTFILPEGCNTDNVQAHLDNGVLSIRIEKAPQSQPRRISLGQGRQAIEGRAQPVGQFQSTEPGQQQGFQAGQEGYQQGQQGYQQSQQGSQAGQQGYQQPAQGEQGYQPGKQPAKAGEEAVWEADQTKKVPEKV